MGTSGPSLFSDDTAVDVRGAYRDLVGDGLTGPEATDRLVQDWGTLLDDPDEGPVFWLALASTQWRVGRLEPRVCDKALEAIDSGRDLARWQHDPKSLAKRTRVLEDLREVLLSPQPPAKRISKRYRDSTDWETGDIVTYRLNSGTLALMRVVGHHEDLGGRSPVLELLDWTGMKAPARWRIKLLRTRVGCHGVKQLMVGRRRASELPGNRVERLGIQIAPAQRPGRYTASSWSVLDHHLEQFFDLR